MDIRENIRVLRLHVLDMTRLSQRSIDYAVKACALGSPESCRGVCDSTFEIDALHCQIQETARELLALNIPGAADFRFVLSSERIGNGMQALHLHAVEIAERCLRLLEVGRKPGCAEINAMGDSVNGLVRLCVVALFEKEKRHADTVLGIGRIERRFETNLYKWLRTLDHAARAGVECERAITRHLSCMARQAHEIADAIVFWLQDVDIKAESDSQKPKRWLCPVRIR
jgi:phosphate uptake regulator